MSRLVLLQNKRLPGSLQSRRELHEKQRRPKLKLNDRLLPRGPLQRQNKSALQRKLKQGNSKRKPESPD